MPRPCPAEPPDFVKSAGRALDLLDEIVTRGPGTLTQLAARLHIPKSSLHALLQTVVGRGWLVAGPAGLYSLGPKALSTGSTYLRTEPLLEQVRPLTRDVATFTRGEAVVARLDRGRLVPLAAARYAGARLDATVVGRPLDARASALGRLLTRPGTADRAEALDVVGDVDPRGGRASYAVALPHVGGGLHGLGVTVSLQDPAARRGPAIVEHLRALGRSFRWP